MTRAGPSTDISRKDIRQALRSWHDSVQLGRSPLVKLPAAEAEWRTGGFSASEVGRGIGLRAALQHAMAALAQTPGLKAERWSTLLTGLYIEGRSPAYLMDSLGLARSTFDHEHAAALEALARSLHDVGEAAPPSAPPSVMRLQMTPPLPLHPVLGRDDLLAEVRRRVLGAAPTSIALHGLPGSGKTTLAAALASDPEVLERYPDGVLWAGLGQRPDMGAKLGQWAGVLGVPWAEVIHRTHSEERCQLVHSAIGERRLLLVVDDVWDLAHTRAIAVAGPQCAQLFTTRSLAVAAELSSFPPVRLPALEIEDGVQLLLHFAPRLLGEDLDLARGLVRSVGGLPLALVLIGRRLRQEAALESTSRMHQVLVDLMDPERRLRIEAPPLPSDAQPTLPPASPLSLYAAIELSEQAMDELTRAGFHALCALPPEPATFDETAALAVSRLPADSLTRLVAAGLVEAAGSGRYRLHPAITDYCRLGGIGPLVLRRLADHTRELLSRAQGSPAELERDLPVIQAGLDAALGDAPSEGFVDLTLALLKPVDQLGAWALAEPYWTKAENWARQEFDRERLLGIQAARAQAALHLAAFTDAECFAMEGLMLALEMDDARQAARMFQTLGAVAFNRGDHTAAESSYRNGLRQAEAEDLDNERCALQANLASVHLVRGQFESAQSLLDQALQLARRLGDVRREASILMNLGVVAAQTGDRAQAARAFEESLELSQKTGSWEQRLFLLVNLGALASDEGQLSLARARFEEALVLAHQLGDRVRICLLLGNLGSIMMQQGNLEAAASRLEQGIGLARAIGQPEALALLLTNAGELDLRQGQAGLAEDRLREALHLADQVGQPRLQAAAQCGLANVLLNEGRVEDAEGLYRSSLELASRSGLRLTEAEAEFGLARVELGQGKKASARRRGKHSLELVLGHSPALEVEVREWIAGLERRKRLPAAPASQARGGTVPGEG